MSVVVIASLWPALGMAATAASPAEITDGTIDDNVSDRGVVALENDGRPFCSGTLIAPRVVLTAAHCVVDHVPTRVFVGNQPGADGTTIAVVDVRIDAAFDRASLGGDVATLLLEREIDVPSWPILPAVEAAALPGSKLRLVGFGRVSAYDTTPPRKRMGVTVVGDMDATSFEFAPSPSQTCVGDSGGPAFVTIGGVEYLAGVTSWGDALCAVHATDTRADAYRDSLIDPAVRTAADERDDAGGCDVAPGRRGLARSATQLVVVMLAAAMAKHRRRP